MSVTVNLMAPRLASLRADELRHVIERAEIAGIDGLGFGDHVSFFTGVGNDGLIAATKVLAASTRLGAMVGVYLLPLRHPVPVARQLADLAAFAPGRLHFGVGIGGEDPHEVEICGVDPRTRGRRMDESLVLLRGLLAGESVTHHGAHFDVTDARIEPAPATAVPILVGGRSDAAARRAGRFGDGWLGVWASPNRFARVVDEVAATATDHGRGPVEWAHALNVWVGIGKDPESGRANVAPAMEGFYQTPFEAFEKWSPVGTPTDIASFLGDYVDAGCSTFNVIAVAGSPEEEIDAVGEIRDVLAD